MTTTLMPMGGALDERRHPEVFLEFLRRAGGAQARILIFPQASARPESGQEYADLFRQLGAGEVQSLEFRQRSQADAPEHLQRVRQASGIFFGGGVQMRLAALLGGTRLEAELLQAYRRGCIVGGTSAGASILSKTMVAYGKGGPSPRERILQMSPGLGFTDRFLFDQHFRQKDRLGRLIYAVASHPGILGVGIDEDTAVVVEDDSRLSVYGSGAVTIVDGRRITASDVAEAENGRPVAAAHLIVHVLTRGCVYERESGQALLAPQPFSA
jgi:cyanophycinase